jgi:inosine/xanthosine triphosphatase
MRLAIGTLRKPKLDGIKDGVAACPYFRDTQEKIEFLPTAAESGIAHMPLSVGETMAGAKNRANHLVSQNIVADYYVGIEGGAARVADRAFLFGCVYIRDKAGRGHFGFSPAIEIPIAIERMLYEEGKELGPVMGELSGKLDIRSENGSMGAWSDDMLTRKDEFAAAFKAAIAPFYNGYYR